MPTYTRKHRPGGTFFLTIVTEHRSPIFADEPARILLHAAIANCARLHPFTLDAMVLLPDHLHLLMTLPPFDANYSLRLAGIKSHFTRAYLAAGGREQPRSASRIRQRTRGVWLKRFWEHTIRDDNDHLRHVQYIHYNPVKHNHTLCPHAWPHSSFHRFVAENRNDPTWCCQCAAPAPLPFDMTPIATAAGE